MHRKYFAIKIFGYHFPRRLGQREKSKQKQHEFVMTDLPQYSNYVLDRNEMLLTQFLYNKMKFTGLIRIAARYSGRNSSKKKLPV